MNVRLYVLEAAVAVAALLLGIATAYAADAPSQPAPSIESLFGEPPKSAGEAQPSGPRLSGFLEFEAAHTLPQPAHWSRLLTRGQVDATGAFSPDVKWKLSGRLDYDAVYDVTDFYSSAVAHDARFQLVPRENYIDINAGDWNFRLGRQQIVWGEMIALFVADVVSAKDLREFVLPDFDIVRIPQWATRAEYFKDDFHAELIWVPVATYNEIGVPGAEFYPAPPTPPPGFATAFENEQFPNRTLAHTNYGLRLSMLRNGWDVSGFYYGSMDQSATFYRRIVDTPQPTFVYQSRHDRINQGGFTVTKDLGFAVTKAEAVYTTGRKFDVNDLLDADGVVPQNTVDWAASIEFPIAALPDARLNLQVGQRAFLHHDANLVADKYESAYSIYASTALPRGWEATLLWGASINRSDSMLRLALARNFAANWRLTFGVDFFSGSEAGIFGQFNRNDRVYTDLRYAF